MIRIADDLEMLRGFPPYAFNVYVMGGVVVDAATRMGQRRILRQLKGRRLTAHALTHAHPDHQGASKAICDQFGVPLWCGEADADAAETEGLIMERMPPHWLTRTVGPHWTGPAHPVARRLREGDEVGGFRVIETPGHTIGHISFWRESDRTLVIGDVVANLNIYLGIPMLREPERIFSIDPEQNRRSAERLAALGPRLICFGHGPPLRDPRRFTEFVARSLRRATAV
jgi:glyoxylase-like metal-dependent hydrolase (beta-lactamase superfamily II)